MKNGKTLLVVTGPTGSGKTELAICIAAATGSEIISADSRQIYKDIPIGTAAPTSYELAKAKHHLVGILDLEDYYSAARFEQDASRLLNEIWRTNDLGIVCGGSMMYIDALCKGIDDLPDISAENRRKAYSIMEQGGLQAVRDRLKELDPEYYNRADLNNHKRLIHAIEVSLQAGRPYSSLLTGKRVKRDYEIVKVALDRDRDTLFERINRRVDRMIAEGMEEEASKVYHKRHLNSLNTVGFKELFMAIEGKMDRETAISRIAKNTRVYAKKQLTWMKKDPEIVLLNPETAYQDTLNLLGLSHLTV